MLRGHLNGIKIPKTAGSLGFNFHLQESDILVHENISKLLDPKVLEEFGVVSPGANLPDLHQVPFHSVLYSNETHKFYFEDIGKTYKTVERGAKLQFIKEDYTGKLTLFEFMLMIKF